MKSDDSLAWLLWVLACLALVKSCANEKRIEHVKQRVESLETTR